MINMLMVLRALLRLWSSVQPTKNHSKQSDCYLTIHSN